MIDIIAAKLQLFLIKMLTFVKTIFMEQILTYFPDLNEKQLDQFSKLQTLYEDWNAKINVISRKDIDELYIRHVLHSLGIAKVQAFLPQAQVLDVGTGGGFPAVPLAIMFPETNFYAVDAIGKKIKVVNAVVEALGLNYSQKLIHLNYLIIF